MSPTGGKRKLIASTEMDMPAPSDLVGTKTKVLFDINFAKYLVRTSNSTKLVFLISRSLGRPEGSCDRLEKSFIV